MISSSHELTVVELLCHLQAASAKGGVVVMPCVAGFAYHFRDPTDAAVFQAIRA
jgi:hypothetical protein